jgi:hypothetical protein
MRSRRIYIRGAAVAALMFLLLPAPASATVAIRLTLSQMVSGADLIVEGTVLSFATRQGTTAQGEMCPALDLPYTDITIKVSQVYKGRITKARQIVRVFGGRVVQNRILRRTYLPFRIGEKLLLFLQMNGTDDFPFPGFHQGILRFRNSAANRKMPGRDAATSPCSTCVPFVVDGRDHLVTGFSNEGFMETFPVSRLPQYHLVVGPGQATVPPEPNVPRGGVLPAGTTLPSQIATPAMVRNALKAVLTSMGMPAPSPMGHPSATLADELAPNEPIVRCGHHALLSDEPEANEPVPGGAGEPPYTPGPSEAHTSRLRKPSPHRHQ